MFGRTARAVEKLALARRLLDPSRMDIVAETNVLSGSHGTVDTKLAADALERSAAYVAAKSVLDLMRQSTRCWPTELAQAARQRAAAMTAAVAQSLEHPPTSAARRRCVRNAIGNAIELSAITDIARAQGLTIADTTQSAGRTMSLLGLAFHATLIPDD